MNKEGATIAEIIRRKTEEMERLCSGIAEETASKRPADRWSPKEILSHLCGSEGVGRLPLFRSFVEKDLPELEMHAEDTYFTGSRSRMTFTALLVQFRKEYDSLADFVETLSNEQLQRKAHVPAFKKAPVGEYPTLKDFLGIIGPGHLEFHIKHMKEILEALGA